VLAEAVMPPIAKGMVLGAVSEWALTTLAIDSKKSSATDAIGKYDMQALLDEMPLAIGTEMPAWLKKRVTKELLDTFKQPYWKKYNETTANDVRKVLDKGIVEGMSIRDLAKAVKEKMGPAYQQHRAVATARTESTAACNAGHTMSIERLEETLGMPVGKEWVSVLGNTTRESHAAIDGMISDKATGMFELSGYKVPYPSHFSLPAEERIQCQCTIISAIVQDATKPKPDPAANEPQPAMTPAPQEPAAVPIAVEPPLEGGMTAAELKELRSGPILDMLAKDPYLNKRMADMHVAANANHEVKQAQVELDRLRPLIQQKQLELEKQWNLPRSRRDDEWNAKQYQMTTAMKELEDEQDNHASVTRGFFRAFWQVSEDKEVKAHFHAEVLPSAGSTETFKDKAKQAKTFMHKLISKDAITGRDTIDFSFRQHTEDRALHITGSGSYLSHDNPLNVFVHEQGHGIEDDLNLEWRAREFRNARADRAKTHDYNLTSRFHWYKAGEYGNDDAWHKVWGKGSSRAGYTGRNYGAPLPDGSQKKHEGPTEVLSMGFQAIHQDPLGMAKADPEYFKFCMGSINGTIKPQTHAYASKPKAPKARQSSTERPMTTGSAAQPKAPEQKPTPATKSEIAKANMTKTKADVQRYAEEYNEPRIAKALGDTKHIASKGRTTGHLEDNEAADVVILDDKGKVKHGIELKTMVANKADKITMKKDAMERKVNWEKDHKATMHTVVINDEEVFNALGEGQHDESNRRIFYRRGYGSFRVGTMYEVKDMEELAELMDKPKNRLPKGAI
jgi:hypothetical protein